MPGMDGSNLLNWRDFERDLRTAKRSPRTIQSYQEAAQQLEDFTAGRWCQGCGHELHDRADFEEMTKRHVQDYLLEVLERHSTQTAAVRFRSLRRFFNWMVTEEIIGESPMKNLTEPKTEDESVTDVPPIDHVRALLATCERASKDTDPRRKFNDVRDAALIRLFCEAGAPRIAEMASIELARLDMALDVVSFLGKGSKWRSVPFGDKTGKALTKYLRVRKKHPLTLAAEAKGQPGPAHLWLGWRGKPLAASGIYQMVERRCDEADVPRLHPHQLRHFAVDAWYADGGSVQDAMALFGWSSPAMAHHYAKQTAGKRAINAARRASIGDQL